MIDDVPLLMVDTDEGLAALARRLARHRVIGVDTESDSMYHYQEKVCLLQFTDSEGDAIVDTLAIRDLSPLGAVLADPAIVKIFHGADYDIVCLKRDFGFQTRNLFDTLVAAQFCGLDRLGLADLIDKFFGVALDKVLQRHDWSQRPLLYDHLAYARGDTHFLLALREILIRRLGKVGRLEHQREECELLERKEWHGRTFDPDGYLRIKGARQLDDEGLAILRRLWAYRDDQARGLDRPGFKVIGDQLLLELAVRRPTDRNALDRLFPRMAALKRRHTSGLLTAILAGLEDEAPPPLPPVRDDDEVDETPLPIVRLRGRVADRVQEALKIWRNRLVETSRMHTPYSVASNSDLKAIARVRPISLEELATIPGLRRWQVRDHGPAILKVLEEAAPLSSLEDEADEDDDRPRRRRRRRRTG